MNNVDKLYTLYAHINKSNYKIYIGITSQRVSDRWRNGSSYKNNPHFYSAIRKYGWDGFYHIVISSGLTRNQAFYGEKLFIRILKTQEIEFGYNMTGGGDIPITHSDIVRKKLVILLKVKIIRVTESTYQMKQEIK